MCEFFTQLIVALLINKKGRHLIPSDTQPKAHFLWIFLNATFYRFLFLKSQLTPPDLRNVQLEKGHACLLQWENQVES